MTVARSHKGSAKPTTLASGISNTATSFSVATGGGTGYPDGSSGVFVVTLDAGNASEEKILCSARVGDAFTVNGGGRGYDDTTAISHVNNASVRHTFSAIEAEELNDHVTDATLDQHTQYALIKKGLAAAIGAAGRIGKLYYKTDSDYLTYDDGAAFHDFQSKAVADAAYPSLAGGSTITASSSSVRPLVVKGTSSQSADLFEAVNTGGTVLLNIEAGGQLSVGRKAVRATTASAAGADVYVETADNSWKGLVVRASVSQSANLAEFQNNGGTVLAAIRADGTTDYGNQALSGSASAGSNGTLPASVSGFLTVYFNGSARKIPCYLP